jgi:hypothetical protein
LPHTPSALLRIANWLPFSSMRVSCIALRLKLCNSIYNRNKNDFSPVTLQDIVVVAPTAVCSVSAIYVNSG